MSKIAKIEQNRGSQIVCWLDGRQLLCNKTKRLSGKLLLEYSKIIMGHKNAKDAR